MTTAPPTMYAENSTCGKVTSCTLFVRTAQKSVISARPVVGLKRKPTGCCMNELAARMK